jgi:hypothetical protein
MPISRASSGARVTKPSAQQHLATATTMFHEMQMPIGHRLAA